MRKRGLVLAAALLLCWYSSFSVKAEETEEINHTGQSQTFEYLGIVEEFVAPLTGDYFLEAWGAQGADGGGHGGCGGYAYGVVSLDAGDILYICVGGQEGYNGGGSGQSYGGGATHIATTNRGMLSSYEYCQSEVLLVAGGGGGGASYGSGFAWGGAGGGETGGNGTSEDSDNAGGGTQTAGGIAGKFKDDDSKTHRAVAGSFGQGGAGTSGHGSGGGGGWYGGGGGAAEAGNWASGGGGSGYLNEDYVSNGALLSNINSSDNGLARISWGDIDIKSVIAGGGSNYVNTDAANSFETHVDVQEGDGYIDVESEDIGFFTDLSIAGVAAPDLAAPGKIMEEGTDPDTGEAYVRMEAVAGSNGTKVKVYWTAPEDNGSDYYHQAESYVAKTGTHLSDSNITLNTLISGVKGYYYLVNTSSTTIVTKASGTYTTALNMQATLTNTAQYLHVAAMDKAGNLGETAHIKIGSLTETPIPVAWPIHTQQLTIGEGDNVYRSSDDTYYVRCDESEAIRLDFSSYIEGAASATYQITHSIFESQMEGQESARNILITPMHGLRSSSIETPASGLTLMAEGKSILNPYSYSKTIRNTYNKYMDVVQDFIVGEEADGKEIRITPVAGVVSSEYEVYSDMADDLTHSLYLIGDATPPKIGGFESINGEMLLDRSEETVTLNIDAEDALSGLAELYVDVYNSDNGSSRTYTAEDDSVSISITDVDALFTGTFSITATAIDNVGNKSEKTYRVTELALDAEAERILSPHDPIFKCGESGILTITAWGYIDKIEVVFPEEMTKRDPDLGKTYTYELLKYKQEEKLQFMIPLYTEEGEYTIEVRAYKDDKLLKKYPTLKVEGTVLDELRTRLR